MLCENAKTAKTCSMNCHTVHSCQVCKNYWRTLLFTVCLWILCPAFVFCAFGVAALIRIHRFYFVTYTNNMDRYEVCM